jgi:O-antigen ligase
VIALFDRGLRFVLLATALILVGITGYEAAYMAMGLSLVTIVRFSLRRSLADAATWRVAGGFALAFAIAALAFAVSARQAQDALLAFNFTMLLLFAPVALIFLRAAGPRAAAIVAALGLAGAATTVLVSIADIVIRHAERAGEHLGGGPLRLASTATLLGCVSLLGLASGNGRTRLMYFAGPLLAFVTIALTGSRGAMLAIPLLAVTAVPFLVKSRRQAVAGVLGIAAVLAVGLAVALAVDSERLMSIFAAAGGAVSGGEAADYSVGTRLAFYQAAWSAFLERPWFGHGWDHVLEAIAPHLPALYAGQAGLPHLHNDLAQWMVAGGVTGLVAYGLIIAAPIAGVLASPRDSLYRARVMGVSLIAVTYVIHGLTNLMIGFEIHTSLFVILNAIIIGYCRDAPVSAASRPAGDAGPSARP